MSIAEKLRATRETEIELAGWGVRIRRVTSELVLTEGRRAMLLVLPSNVEQQRGLAEEMAAAVGEGVEQPPADDPDAQVRQLVARIQAMDPARISQLAAATDAMVCAAVVALRMPGSDEWETVRVVPTEEESAEDGCIWVEDLPAEFRGAIAHHVMAQPGRLAKAFESFRGRPEHAAAAAPARRNVRRAAK